MLAVSSNSLSHLISLFNALQTDEEMSAFRIKWRTYIETLSKKEDRFYAQKALLDTLTNNLEDFKEHLNQVELSEQDKRDLAFPNEIKEKFIELKQSLNGNS